MSESQLAIEASYFGAFQDGVNDQKDRIVELEMDIDRLKVELEEVNELSKKECREHALFALSTGERIGALERQLAEARAELRKRDNQLVSQRRCLKLQHNPRLTSQS